MLQDPGTPRLGEQALDATLTEVLRQHRTALERGGVVQRRPNGRYRLRWREFDAERGYRVHRSLSLGSDPDEARAVEATISRWKARVKQAKEKMQRTEAEQARAEKGGEAEERLRHRLIALGVGGGRDEQRKTIKALQMAIKAGPAEVLRFVLTLGQRTPTKPGRPPRRRIW